MAIKSKKIAVAIGKQIATALEIETKAYTGVNGLTFDQNHDRRIGARGMAFSAVKNLRYDEFHVSLRAQWDYTLEAYLKEIGLN